MRRWLFRIVVLGAVIPYGLPAYIDRIQLALALGPHSVEERKEQLFAPWYSQVAAIGISTGSTAAIDLVMLRPESRDIAVLAGAALFPRDVRFFDGWDAWRARRRATFLHDARAANAAPGPPPADASAVIVVDPFATPQLKRIR